MNDWLTDEPLNCPNIGTRKEVTMSTTMPGVRIPPLTPMTDEQYRAHRRLGSAEKRLIQAYVYGAPTTKIAKLEATVARLTKAWQHSCRPNVGTK